VTPQKTARGKSQKPGDAIHRRPCCKGLVWGRKLLRTQGPKQPKAESKKGGAVLEVYGDLEQKLGGGGGRGGGGGGGGGGGHTSNSSMKSGVGQKAFKELGSIFQKTQGGGRDFRQLKEKKQGGENQGGEPDTPQIL